MYNFYAKFAKILEICKFFSENLVTEEGNIRRPGPVPKFSDLEVIALSLTPNQKALTAKSGYSTANCRSIKIAFPTSYLGENIMTAERKRQDYVKKSVRE